MHAGNFELDGEPATVVQGANDVVAVRADHTRADPACRWSGRATAKSAFLEITSSTRRLVYAYLS
jgi:hypothetical protein